MKNIISLLACVFLTACNSVDHHAADAIVARGAASVQGSEIEGDLSLYGRRRIMFWVTHIDGEEVKEHGYFRVYEVPPGRRTIGVGGGAVKGQFAGTKSLGGESAVNFTAETGHKYEIRGTVSESSVSLFVFDLTTGVPASDTATVDAHASERKLPILILIPIP